MIKRFYILLLAIVASVGMMNAKVTWNSSNISDLQVVGTYASYSKEGVTLKANADMIDAWWQGYGDESHDGISFNAHATGGFTFSNSLGKNFTKIEMTLNGSGGWDMANLGSGWSYYWDYMEPESPATVTWTGNASTVDLFKEASDFGGENVKSIVFYFVGDSEAPDPTYTVALKAGTVNADKVTLSATSAVEGATVTVTPDDEYEITAFSAYYVVVEDQLGSIYDIDATLNTETGAYSFTMPAYAVTIEATIAAKPVPEGDIYAGFTATAGSGGFDNEGSANLVDNKFTSTDWTKWCTNDGHKSVPTGESESCWWIDFEASAALYPTGYILTTGNDSGSETGRNPKNWVLKAKLNAGDAWTTIATVTNDVTMKNKSFKDYKFFVDQSGSYKYFRFEVFANQGANVMQLCQLRLIGTDTPAPAPAWVRDGDTWDESTKTLTVNSNTSDNAYASKHDIKHLIVGDAVTELGWGTFFFDSLMTTVELGNNLEIIGISAFNECRSLSTITVPASVTNIKVRAFQDCRSLTTFICEAVTPPTIGNAIFQNDNNLTAIYVPAASVDAYKSAWSDYASLIKAIGGGSTPTVWTSLSVGDVIKVGDKIEVPNEGDGSWGINGNVLRNAWGPYTLIRADIYQASEFDDPVVTETEDGAFYVFKAENSAFYPLSNLGKGTGLVVTGTSDGLEVTAAENKEFTVAVHDGGAAPATPAYEKVMNLINEIGTVELTAECKAKIDAARAAFIALSDGDKAQVSNIATLTTAEAAFDNVMDIWLSGDCDAILWKDTTLTVRKHAGEGNGAMADYDYMSRAPWYNNHWYDPKPNDIVIKSVTIEEGVTHLGDYAFAWMSETKTVTIPSSVTTIPEDAFYWSKAVDDIYLTVADTANLTWALPYSADAQFKPSKATLCHVPADLLTAYQEKFGTLNMTFVGDLAPVDPAAGAAAIVDLINAIGTVEYTDECKAKIDAAREAYDKAVDAVKDLISADDLKKLTDAETEYADLKAAADQAAAAPVIAKINNIPQPVTLKLDTRDSIESARAAYDALTADQQALVSNYQTLLDAEDALAALNPGGSVPVDIVWDGNTGIANVDPNTTSPAYEGMTVTVGNGSSFSTYQSRLYFTFYSQPNGGYIFANENGTNITKVVIESTTALTSTMTEVDRMGSGWVISNENKTATWTGNADSVSIWKGQSFTNYWVVDTITFTVNGVGATPLDSALAVKDLIEAIPAEITLDAACVKAIEDARAAYDALSDNAKGVLDNADVTKLTDAEQALKDLNQAKADEVIAKINNIPTTIELKLATRDSIQNARAAYDALNAAQQALVTNYTKLTNAEEALAALNPGVPPATPLDSAQIVKDLIDAIPTPVEYPTSGPAIAAALVAYQQLSDAAKGALDDADKQKMTDAATQYAALDAIAAIEAIPTEIVYDPLVKTAIETARDKFDKLIDASKALVDAEVVAKLTNAEQAWAILVAKVEHNVSYIGKDGELKHETVALLHIPDPAPDFNGYEFVRWDVKAGNFLEEGLRVKAVYTPIITTNPQGFDTLAYNGLAQELVKAGVAKDGHIEYSLYPEEPESWSAELPKATIAGVYAIYYKLVREGHADYIASEPTMATIAKVPVTYVAPTAVENLVYNASNQTLIAAGQTNDGTFEYTFAPDDEESWNTELPQAMNAGTYSVYYRVQGDINHLDSTAVDPIAVTIAKAELTATADDKNVIYGDAVPAYTVTYAGWQGTDDATVLTGAIAYACEYASTSNVGEYTIVPSGVDAANYTITFVNGKVTVAKAESGCVAPVAYDTLVYNGANQTLIMGGQPMGGEMQYSLDTTVLDCWSTSLPQAKNVGTYNVYYRVKGDMNHNDHYYDLIAVSIAKAALTATAEDKTVTYGDAAPEYTVVYAGWHGTDDASVLTGAIAYACDYLPTSNVGNYTITPSGVDAANYAIQFINGKVTVNKADLMITADDKSVIYGDAVPEYTASYSGFKNSDDASVVSDLAYTCEYAVTSNVGEYAIVPSSATATNYAISYTNGKITVAQAALTITANDTVMIYGDEHPEFTVTYSGWKNTDDESVVSGLQFSTPYAPGSYIGTYTINPNSATALNYAITFVDGTLTVNKAHVYVSGAEAQIAKFADGHANAVVLKQGVLNGIKLNDPIAHVTTAAFSSADVAENLTITLFYELTGDAALLNNYHLDPTSDIFTTEGVIIEPFIPDDQPAEKEDEEAEVKEGIEIYAYGYCDGSGYSLKYHLESGNPDQYKIDFADSRFTDVDWTNLVITGKDGTIDIDIPVDLPTGDYTMTVYFRDSRFDWLESRQFNVTFHVNLPETYVRPLFDNVIALVDTCNCLTDIQWYWRANSTDTWVAIPGANGYYYHSDTKLEGEYFVSAKMNGEPTYTCGQADMETLYGNDNKQQNVQVKAYPNPVVTTTIVTIEGSENFDHNLRVVNLTGVEVLNTTFEGNETTVDMNGYVTGNYMISVDGITVKVLKQ